MAKAPKFVSNGIVRSLHLDVGNPLSRLVHLLFHLPLAIVVIGQRRVNLGPRLTGPLIQAEERVEAYPEDHADGAGGFARVDLGRAGPAVFENDRRFTDPATGLAASVEHFLLK